MLRRRKCSIRPQLKPGGVHLKLRNAAFIASVFVTVTATVPVLAADTSQTIIYSNCDPSLSGTVDLRVRFFDAAAAGNLLYEETEAGLNVDASGCFIVSIGNATALSAALFANPSVWIAFALDATPDTELGGGRQPITGNGYAFRAKVAENAQTLPAGAVIVADQLGPGLTVQNPNAGGNGLHVTAGNDGIDGTGGYIGVLGHSTGVLGRGVAGVADGATGANYGNTFGVIGESPSASGGRGVWGKATATSGDAIGVYGESNSPSGDGVYGIVLSGTQNAGVHAVSNAFNGNGLIAEANTGSSAYAIWGKSSTGYAGYFDGKVQVNGGMAAHFVQITGGSDLSEKFEVRGEKSEIEPGMVVAIDPVNPGKLAVSARAYDRRVVGILSGAGGVAPGMLMGHAGTLADGAHPVALSGRVYVWADASNGPIEAGDLLSASSLPGHAMKVNNYGKAQGAILGKAMTALDKGRGLVLVLVTLQ